MTDTLWLKVDHWILNTSDIVAVHYEDVSRPTVWVYTRYAPDRPHSAWDDEALALWAWWCGVAIDVLAEDSAPMHRRAKLVD
jgi:hypothetical protein